MAYDKVVDSAALEAALKASADAIRGKTGGTDTIPWDAVKGFADAIAAISAGGGGSGGEDIVLPAGMGVEIGEFTFAEDTTGAYTSVYLRRNFKSNQKNCVFGFFALTDGAQPAANTLVAAMRVSTGGSDVYRDAYINASGSVVAENYGRVKLYNHTNSVGDARFSISAGAGRVLAAGIKYLYFVIAEVNA